MKTSALSITKSLPASRKTGTLLRPSEPVAVLPLTPTGLDCSPGTVAALTAILAALLDNTLNPDVLFLSMVRARSIAEEAGISEEEFERVKDVICERFAQRRRVNVMQRWFDGS